MILAPVLDRVKVYGAIILVVLVMTVLTFAFFASKLSAPVHAKSTEPIPDCVAIGKAGASVVSRCEDTELDKVCYVTTGGFMFCLDE